MGISYGYGPAADKQEMISLIRSAVERGCASRLSWLFALGGLPAETLRSFGLVTWTFALSFVVITLLTWRYFFIAPLVFSGLVALCLLLAAWSAARA